MEIDARPGIGEVRVLVDPRPVQCLARAAETGDRLDRGVSVAVGPAGDHEARDLHRGEVLADRAAFPELVAPLMRRPGEAGRPDGLQSLEPHRPPTLADDLAVRWPRHVPEHRRGPTEMGAHVTTVAVVDVVVVPIDRRGDGDHRLQRGWATCRDLQRVETTPADAHHPDGSAAPRLLGDPSDDGFAIGQFGLRVLVFVETIGITCAAHVDTNAGVAGAGESGVRRLVAGRCPVAAAVRQQLQHRGRRHGRDVGGQPQAGGQTGPSGNLDPRRFDHLDRRLSHGAAR